MKTYVKTFTFNYYREVENGLNEYFRKHNLTPLSISTEHNGGYIYVAVVVEKKKEVIKSCLNCDNQYSEDCKICITSGNPNSLHYKSPSHWTPKESEDTE
jgi:hypothetical protein